MRKNRLMLLALIVITFGSTLTSGQTRQAKPMNILVYPFENMSEKRFSWISSGTTDTVIADLGRVQNVNVFSEDDRRKAIKEIEFSMTGLVKDELQLNVGKIMGANIIFTGSYTVIGEQIRIIAKLINVETTKVERSAKFDGNLKDLFQLQDKLIIGILAEATKMSIADLKPVDIQQAEAKLSTRYRPVEDAYVYYSKGLELHYTNHVEALNFYDKALGVNPGYLEPYIRKIEIYISTSSYEKAIKAILVAQNILKSRPNIEFDKLGQPVTREYADLLYSYGLVLKETGRFEDARGMALDAQKIYEKVYNTKLITFELARLSAQIAFSRRPRYLLKRWGDPPIYSELMLFLNAGRGYLFEAGLKDTEKYAIILIDQAEAGNVLYLFLTPDDIDDKRVFPLLREAEQILNKLKLTNSSTYIDLLNNYAYAHINKKEFQKALEYLNKSVGLQVKNKTINSVRYAKTLEAFGLCYEKEGWYSPKSSDKVRNYQMAIKYYNEQLKKLEELKMKTTYHYADAFDNLTYIYNKYYKDPCGKYKYLKESIEIRKRNKIEQRYSTIELDLQPSFEECESLQNRR